MNGFGKGVTAFRLTPRAPECHSERVYTGAGSQMHRNVMALDANAKANAVAWENERLVGDNGRLSA